MGGIRVGGAGAVARAVADLVGGAACAGCAAAAHRRGLCRACSEALSGIGAARPVPGWSRPPAATGAGYAGVVAPVLIAHKEYGRRVLERPLGTLLAAAIDLAVGMATAGEDGGRSFGHVALVPVPTSKRARRRRCYRFVGSRCGWLRRCACGAAPPIRRGWAAPSGWPT